MNIKDIADKRYSELSDEGIALLTNILEEHNTPLELRNKLGISLLFGDTIKEAMTRLK